MAAVKTPKLGLAGHTAGIFADMSLDGPEIGTLVAVIDRARNLPNRKTIGKQDPYCAMRLGKEAKKTETDRRGGQTPKWYALPSTQHPIDSVLTFAPGTKNFDSLYTNRQTIIS